MCPRLLGLLCFLAAAPLSAQTPAYWPLFGGPDRNHVSRETGLLKEWPKDGPRLVWKVTDLGGGLAPVSIAEGRIYTLAFRQTKEFAVALDRGTGKEMWVREIGIAREGPGMRHLRQRQPVIDQDRLYVFSGDGELFCLDADAGQLLWSKNYTQDFGGRKPGYGWNENPLIDGDRLICSPGGKGGTVLALNKKTGEMLWKTSLAVGDSSSIAPGVLVQTGGVRQYVQMFSGDLVGLSPHDGKVLWEANLPGGPPSQPPLVRGDSIFVMGRGVSEDSALLKIVAW